MDLEHRKMRRPIARLIRPVVVVQGADQPTRFMFHHQSTGGDWEDGWWKTWYYPYTDDYPSIVDSLGSRDWRVGREILVNSFYANTRAISGSYGYDVNCTMIVSDSGSISSDMIAMGPGLEELGSIFSQTCITSDEQSQTITGFAYDETHYVNTVSLSGGNNGYNGPLHAILVSTTWSQAIEIDAPYPPSSTPSVTSSGGIIPYDAV